MNIPVFGHAVGDISIMCKSFIPSLWSSRIVYSVILPPIDKPRLTPTSSMSLIWADLAFNKSARIFKEVSSLSNTSLIAPYIPSKPYLWSPCKFLVVVSNCSFMECIADGSIMSPWRSLFTVEAIPSIVSVPLGFSV